MLPESNLSIDESARRLTGITRNSHRMREIAIGTKVECSAQDRINRALNPPTWEFEQQKDF